MPHTLRQNAMSQAAPRPSHRVPVPFGDLMTPKHRRSRRLEIMDDLEPLAFLSQEDFVKEDRREEAGAYAAALGRCASKLPSELVWAHPEIDWKALADLNEAGFYDQIDVLILRDRLRDLLPALRDQLEDILARARS